MIPARIKQEIVAEPNYKLGPRMAALPEAQKKFVIAMLEYPSASNVAAAAAAGYSGNENSLKSTAHRLAHDPKVQAAIQEEGYKRLFSAQILAASKVIHILDTSTEDKITLRAAEIILDRTGIPKKTEQTINVNHSEVDGDAQVRILRACSILGVDPEAMLGRAAKALLAIQAPAAEDAEFEEIEIVTGYEGLEDVL